MSDKKLLTESEVRRFMKLANLEPLAKNLVKEAAMAPASAEEGSHKEETYMEASGEKASEEYMQEETFELEEEEMEGAEGVELKDFFEKLKMMLKPEFADQLEVEDSEMGADAEAEEEPVDMEEPADDMAGEEEETEEEEEAEGEEAEESLTEDELVENVLNRVTARLVAEAKGKTKTAAQKKKEELKKKMAAKKKKAVKKESIEEATSAEGGGPLLKKGGNKYDPWQGVKDMKMGKGEKGGAGGHEMVVEKAHGEHTVSHSKTSKVVSKGGNKS